MAVATEVAWRAPPGANQMQLPTAAKPMPMAAVTPAVATAPKTSRPAWDADTQKLMHLMLPRQFSDIGFTLDLLGNGGVGRGEQSGLKTVVDEILEVKADHPLPSGWDQCLNLKVLVV